MGELGMDIACRKRCSNSTVGLHIKLLLCAHGLMESNDFPPRKKNTLHMVRRPTSENVSNQTNLNLHCCIIKDSSCICKVKDQSIAMAINANNEVCCNIPYHTNVFFAGCQAASQEEFLSHDLWDGRMHGRIIDKNCQLRMACIV